MAFSNNNQRVKMPVSNVGSFPVKLGSGQNSSFGSSVKPAKAQRPATQSRRGGRTNMPTHNNGIQKVQLGHTKHGVGEVPGYLKGNQ